jgi:hypothetical protein
LIFDEDGKDNATREDCGGGTEQPASETTADEATFVQFVATS